MKKTLTGLVIAVVIAAAATWISDMTPFVSLDNREGVPGGFWPFVISVAVAAVLYWWTAENTAFVIAVIGLAVALLCRWGGFEMLQDLGWLVLFGGVSAGMMLAAGSRPHSGH